MATGNLSTLVAINKKRITMLGDLTTILVGAEENRYIVHESALRANTPFFDAAIENASQETGERLVKLPEQASDQFDVYVQWLYLGLCKGFHNRPFSMHDLARLYILGHQLEDHDFQDAVFDEFICRCNAAPQIPSGNIVHHVFQHTAPDDPMRQLLVDLRVHSGHVGSFDDETGAQMGEFYFKVAKGAMEGPRRGTQWVITEGQRTCKYHQHRDNPCYRGEQGNYI